MKERPEIEVFLGGDVACFAHLVCENCGAVLDETRHQHREVNDDVRVDDNQLDETKHDATS